jgi:hypothetical protein
MTQLDKIKKFIELRSSGYSLRDISKILILSSHTLVKWNKKYCSVVYEVQSEELNAYKRKILDEKLSRLEYLNSKYTKLKEKIDNAEIIMRYDRMLILLMKISKSIDDCQKNIILSEISDKIDELDKNDILNEISSEEKVENVNENT